MYVASVNADQPETLPRIWCLSTPKDVVLTPTTRLPCALQVSPCHPLFELFHPSPHGSPPSADHDLPRAQLSLDSRLEDGVLSNGMLQALTRNTGAGKVGSSEWRQSLWWQGGKHAVAHWPTGATLNRRQERHLVVTP